MSTILLLPLCFHTKYPHYRYYQSPNYPDTKCHFFREPSTTCPSPPHCMESPICRLGRPLPRWAQQMISCGKWISFNWETGIGAGFVVCEIQFSCHHWPTLWNFRPKNDFTSRTPWLFGLDQPMPRRRQVASLQEPPDHSFENHLNVKIPSKASSPNSPAATFSYLDINTKNDLFCFVRRVNSVACCSSPLRWWLIPKSMALHVTDCNSVFVAELLEIQIETINVNEERSL